MAYHQDSRDITSFRHHISAIGLATALTVAALPAWGAPPDAPTRLRINDIAEPVGTGAAPWFGWQVNDSDDNEIQSAYRIQVATNATFSGTLLWDSGATASRLQNHIPYGGTALSSDLQCFWRVKTWDTDSNEGAWSATNTFTVGLLDNSDWSGASWIKRSTTVADDYTYYRKQATLDAKPIERATVYISSVHKYALYVNGSLVGKGPAYHHPEYQYYNAFDITDLLQSGAANQFAVFNHWFGGGQGRPESARGVIMKAIVHYTDGSMSEIGTDATWKQAQATAWDVSSLTARNTYEGVGYVEKIDARNLEEDWMDASFDDSSWSTATEIGEQPVSPWTGNLSPDLTRIEETVIMPESITSLGGGSYLIDLGKVYAGVPRITFSGGTSGTTISMAGGYVLSGNEIDSSQNQAVDMSYYAVLNGSTFTYEPVEYLGMRYFQIDNAPMTVTTDNFEFVVRHSTMDTSASSFTSSDATLNAVWDLMKHSLLTCAQEEFVDTPTREKGGFLGDAAIQSTVAMPVMNERTLTRRVLGEYLQSMDSDEYNGTGRMNAVYPNNDGARDIPDFTQAYLVWVWNYYMETGDLEFLSENYSYFQEIISYLRSNLSSSGSGLVRNLEGGTGSYLYGIIDWPSAMRFGYETGAQTRTVINGWAYADYDAMARIAGALGNPSDQTTYQGYADALKTAMNSYLVDANGLYVDGLHSDDSQYANTSQHANMFPLALGMVPAENRDAVIAEIKRQQMNVGMVTLPWLIRAVGEADEGEYLIELFTNEDWLGWAQCLADGATATWESWYSDSTTDESMSHAWGASGLEGYLRYILGIKPTLPQYEQIEIKPLNFGSALASASGTIPTDRGDITVSWERSGTNYTLTATLPANTTADIALPLGEASDPAVTLDGTETEYTDDGTYLWIESVGSGTHSLALTDLTTPSTPTNTVGAAIQPTATLSGTSLKDQSGTTIATSSIFTLNGGNAVALLLTAERNSTSESFNATFAGQSMTLGVSASEGIQWAGIFYLIDPEATSGEFIITSSSGGGDYAYSAIALENVVAIADAASITSTATSTADSLLLNYSTTTKGFALGACVNNGYNSSYPAPSFISGNADQTLLDSTLIDSSGHLHTYGDVPSGGSQTDEYGNPIQRSAYVTLAFEGYALSPLQVVSKTPESGATIALSEFPLTLEAILTDGNSTLDINSVALHLDTTNSLTLTVEQNATTTTVRHVIASLEPGTHSLSLVYEGLSPASGPFTNTWSFTVRGNPPICPRWAFEPWVWEDEENTQDSTTGLIDGYRSRNIPVGAVMVDSPWATSYNSFEWNTDRYADAASMISSLRADGVHVVLWTTGAQNITSDDTPEDESPYYQYVIDNDYAVNDGDTYDWWKGTGVHIDFTNPDACDWFGTLLGEMMDLGVDGWKVDQAESSDYLPYPVTTSIGSLSKEEFKPYYYAAVRDQAFAHNPDSLIIARPYSHQDGYAASIDKCTVGWGGDYNGSFSSLRSQLSDLYTSAATGYGTLSVEIGGYQSTVPTKETLIRYAQFGALMPVMENGGSNGGLSEHLPWNWDTETVDIYRYYATLHSELAPYLFSGSVDSHLYGGSIVKSPDTDEETHLLGDQLFVALITDSVTRRDVTLPNDSDWIDYWDETQLYSAGTNITAAAPLDTVPLYIRAGAIIPMNVSTNLTGHGDASSAGQETIAVYPCGSSTCTYHRALGDGIEYTNVVISMNESAGTLSVAGGKTADYRFRIKSFSKPYSVSGADSWYYDAANQYLIADKTGNTFTLAIAGLQGYSNEQDAYSVWQETYGIGGALFSSDSDTNGIPDGMEYYLGTNPTNPSSPAALFTWSSNYLSITHPFNPQAVGVTGTVEWTTDLASGIWSDTGITFITNTNPDEIDATLGTSTTSNLFIRLRVTR